MAAHTGKVKPLTMILRVGIKLQIQCVFILTHPYGTLEVTTFKPSIEGTQ